MRSKKRRCAQKTGRRPASPRAGARASHASRRSGHAAAWSRHSTSAPPRSAASSRGPRPTSRRSSASATRSRAVCATARSSTSRRRRPRSWARCMPPRRWPARRSSRWSRTCRAFPPRASSRPRSASPAARSATADLRRVLDHGYLMREPGDRQVIHSVPVGFSIDDSRGIRDPRGMFGERLGVNMHMVTAGRRQCAQPQRRGRAIASGGRRPCRQPLCRRPLLPRRGRDRPRCHRDRHGRRDDDDWGVL